MLDVSSLRRAAKRPSWRCLLTPLKWSCLRGFSGERGRRSGDRGCRRYRRPAHRSKEIWAARPAAQRGHASHGRRLRRLEGVSKILTSSSCRPTDSAAGRSDVALACTEDRDPRQLPWACRTRLGKGPDVRFLVSVFRSRTIRSSTSRSTALGLVCGRRDRGSNATEPSR
jgi:hypothetical protein